MQARLASLPTSERGIAVPTVLSVMVIGLGFSAAAVISAVNSQSGSKRDQANKNALAIADAGAQRALATYNKIVTDDINQCVRKTGSGSSASLAATTIPAGTGGWCEKVGGVLPSGVIDSDSRVGDGYFTYWVNPCNGPGGTGDDDDGTSDDNTPPQLLCKPTRELLIVAKGCSNTSTTCTGGLERRVAIRASGEPGTIGNAGDAKAVGLDGITMNGWSELEVDAATNGDFVVSATNGTGVCGDGVAGCPRICDGDYNQALEQISVGVEDDDDLILPSGTQRCTSGRVNPPGPPESDFCNEGGIQFCSEVAHKQVVLPQVELGNIADDANNDNQRLGLLGQTGGDTSSGICTFSGTTCTASNGTITWNPTSRVLTLNGPPTNDPGFQDNVPPYTPEKFANDLPALTLTLGGADYVLCKLQLNGRAVLQSAGGLRRFPGIDTSNVSTRVFFDSPENCGLASGTAQLSVRDISRIASEGWCALCSYPEETAPAPDHHLLPQFLMVGSTSTGSSFRTTKAEFVIDGPYPYNFTSTQLLMLYAPRTEITLDTSFGRENEGYFAGKRLDIVHGSEIESPLNMDKVGWGIVEPDFTNYESDRYIECGRPGATPDANCLGRAGA
jgi:hypothetical protein